jgi:hypothetical protein
MARRALPSDGDATGDQRERGADPGEEGPLVGEREAVVRLLLVAGRLGLSFLIGRVHELTPPPARPIRRRAWPPRPRRAGDSTRTGCASTDWWR